MHDRSCRARTQCVLFSPAPSLLAALKLNPRLFLHSTAIKVFRTGDAFICPKCEGFTNRDPVSLQTHAKNCRAVYTGPTDPPPVPTPEGEKVPKKRGRKSVKLEPLPPQYDAEGNLIPQPERPEGLGPEGSLVPLEPNANGKTWICNRCDPPLHMKNESERAMHYRSVFPSLLSTTLFDKRLTQTTPFALTERRTRRRPRSQTQPELVCVFSIRSVDLQLTLAFIVDACPLQSTSSSETTTASSDASDAPATRLETPSSPERTSSRAADTPGP